MKKNTISQYQALMQQCETDMVGGFTVLLGDMLAKLDDDMLERSEKALNNEMRHRHQEALFELHRHKKEIEALFCRILRAGFRNFSSETKEADTAAPPIATKKGQLSLVDTEQYEKELAINQIVHSACNRFISTLFALGRRLAIVNDGKKISETSGDFPAGPRHLCNAFNAATASISMDPKIELELVELFDHYVVSQAEALYNGFNDALRRAGLLPDLIDAEDLYEVGAGRGTIGHTTPEQEPSQPPKQTEQQFSASSQAPETPDQSPPRQTVRPPSPLSIVGTPTLFAHQRDAVIEEQLYQGISELLARRYALQKGAPPTAAPAHPGTTVSAGAASLPRLIDLLNALQQTATQSIPQQAHPEASMQPLMEHAKATLDSEVAKLVDAGKNGAIPTSSATTIDLIGLLFQHILDDAYIPDSVKALLGHLHTPYLKMALLDDQFFVGEQNPARQLLNAMSYAGSRCNIGDANDRNTVAKIQEIVNRILNEFDQNAELFTELLNDFSRFMESLSRRSEAVQRRVVETAESQQRLIRARRLVSNEMIERCVARNPPKPIQDLLLNPWANHLTITLLRHGKNSDEWRRALIETDDLIWSVQPQKMDSDKLKLYDKIPDIIVSLRRNMKFIGLLAGDIESIQNQVTACHKAALLGSKFGSETDAEGEQPESAQTLKKQLRSKLPEEWMTAEMTEEEALGQKMTQELKDAAARIKKLELGTWLEFTDKKSDRTLRGKLAWVNQHALKYMFVNQSGRQIAVIARYDLATAMARGKARILPIEKEPFITRALDSIHRMLRNQSKKGSSDLEQTKRVSERVQPVVRG